MMTPAIDQAHDQGSAASERARHFIAWGGRKRKKGPGGQRNPLNPIPQSASKTIKANSFACLGRDLAWLGPILVGLE